MNSCNFTIKLFKTQRQITDCATLVTVACFNLTLKPYVKLLSSVLIEMEKFMKTFQIRHEKKKLKHSVAWNDTFLFPHSFRDESLIVLLVIKTAEQILPKYEVDRFRKHRSDSADD